MQSSRHYIQVFKQVGIRRFSKKGARKLRKEVYRVWRNLSPYNSPYKLESNQFFRVFKNNFQDEREIVAYFTNRKEPRFILTSENKEEILSSFKGVYPEEIQKTLLKAEEICRHRFYFLGEQFNFSDKIDWHYEPINGQSWPKRFIGVDDFSVFKLGDIKYPWELNRHQYFSILGKAYWLSDDEKYAQEFTCQILSWIKNNQPEIGINWISSLELGIRIISWLIAFYFFKDSHYFQKNGCFEFLKSLYIQTNFLSKNLTPPFEVQQNNHSIGEAAALAIMGLMFPEFSEEEEWLRIGLDILTREIENQVYPDGVDYEQTTSYHRFVLDFYLFFIAIAQKNNFEVSSKITEKMEKMLEFIMYITKPDGTIPMFGDADDGRGFKFTIRDDQDYSSPLAIGAVIFDRADFKWIAKQFDEEAFWFLGNDGLNEFNKMAATAPNCTSIAFSDGGYYIMRSDWSREALSLIVDCGFIGLGPNGIGGHGHNDTLSFDLFAYGEAFILDSGTYTYLRSREWRDYFRKTSAHNTVVIDGQEIAELGGLFEIKNGAEPVIYGWRSTIDHDFFDGAHYGYKKLLKPVEHRREILFVKPSYWVMRDVLTGEGTHLFDLFFHFASLEARANENSKVVLAKGKRADLAVIPLSEANLEMSIEEEWLSPSYGIKTKSAVLKYTKMGRCPVEFMTVFHPFRKGEEISVAEVKTRALDAWSKYENFKE